MNYGTWECDFLGQEKLIMGHHKMNYGTKQGHFLGYWKMILVYIGRWSYGRFWDDNKVFQKMKHDLTTGTWQDNIWCPIHIFLICTSDVLPPSAPVFPVQEPIAPRTRSRVPAPLCALCFRRAVSWMHPIPHPHRQILTRSSGSNGVCRSLRHASHDNSGDNPLCRSLLCSFAQEQPVGPVSSWPYNHWYARALPTPT